MIMVYFVAMDIQPETTEPKMRYAKDCKCSRCEKEGKDTQAVVFVGMADPDATQYPMCRKHADEWHFDVIVALQGGLD